MRRRRQKILEAIFIYHILYANLITVIQFTHIESIGTDFITSVLGTGGPIFVKNRW